MAETTGIAWCDATFNPWIGCTKVSAGCANCYAERDNKRYSWVAGWGKGAPRRLTSAENWKKPLAWARAAVKAGVVRRVFCASLADVLDDEVPQEWRRDLFALINETGKIGGLEWLLLTKRDNNFRLLPSGWIDYPPDFVRVGVTAENQAQWDIRVPRLVDGWPGKNFVSVEPMLSRVIPREPVDWIISGCESGPNARTTEDRWVECLLRDCEAFGIPFFLKQMMQGSVLVKEPVFNGRKWLEFPK